MTQGGFSTPKFLTLPATILFAFIGWSSAAGATPMYSLTALGTLGGSHSTGTSLNDQGQVVGYSETASGDIHAFLWDSGTITDLGTIGGNFSEATDINDLSQIVGRSTLSNGESRAFLYQSGSFTTLPTLGGTYNRANAINNSGQVVGETRLPNDSPRPFLYANGSLTDLSTYLPAGKPNGNASDINESGQIVGTFRGPVGSAPRGFILDPGVSFTTIPTLGGFSSDADDELNDNGQVVSDARQGNGRDAAYLYENGVLQSLGFLPGHSQSDALGINNDGIIVGYSEVAPSKQDRHAFLYFEDDMFDLNDLIAAATPVPEGLILAEAVAINENGQIVANALTVGDVGDGSSPRQTFLLTPLSEISVSPTASLFAFGLGCLAVLLAFGRKRDRPAKAS